MEEKTTWQPLIPIDIAPNLVEPGIRSREKDVQYAREKVILQALYFSRTMYVDSVWNSQKKCLDKLPKYERTLKFTLS